MARPPGSSDPNLDQNYDIFVGTILAFNANVLHAPNRVRSEIRKDPSVTLFFGRTSLSNRNIVLAILLLAGDVHPNPGPINRETIYPCGYCQQHVGCRDNHTLQKYAVLLLRVTSEYHSFHYMILRDHIHSSVSSEI